MYTNACTYSGCVTAVAQPTSPLLSNVYSLAQMCVQHEWATANSFLGTLGLCTQRELLSDTVAICSDSYHVQITSY